jgi:FHS family L-fucose permease-like MFS transporter
MMSWPAAKVIAAIGYKRTIVLGLSVMACGALLFVPAALMPSYAFFLGALYVLAAGMTFLQVSANPYVAVLGLPEGASSRLNLVQALNSLGTTVGPAVGGLLILSSGSVASTVIKPYLGIAALLLVLAVVLARFPLPVLEHIEQREAGDSIWRHRHLVLGAVAIFTYVGAEVAIGSFLVNYFVQPDIGALAAPVAAQYVSLYWGGAMMGRFAGAAILRRVRTGPAVGVAAIVAALLVATSILTTGHVAM